jgi:hypothetical protein
MMKYFALLLAGVLSLAGALSAQTTNGLVVSTSTEAVGLHFNNAWGPANITTVSLDVFDFGASKGNSLSAAEYTVLASGGGFSSYLGGVHFVPDVSSLVKHTNIPSDQFGVFVEGAAGNTTFANSTPNKFTFLFGAGSNYRLTPNISWSTIDFRIGRVGAQTFYTASSGLVYFFNPQASQNLAVKRMLVRSKIRQSLKAQEDTAAASVK